MGVVGRWYATFGKYLPELDPISYVNADVLREAWRHTEADMRTAAREGRPAHMLVTGDICTWPYEHAAIQEAYGLFSDPSTIYQEQRIGLSRDTAERLIVLIGNHDTFSFEADGAYRASPFHTVHAAAAQTRVFPVNVGERWIVYFLARTDCLLGLGWLGGRLGGSARPEWLRRLHAEHELAMQGRSSSVSHQGCSPAEYARATKLLVLHHSPLEPEYYAGMNAGHYVMTQLTEREAIPQFCRDVGITAVLFGHSHDPKDAVVDGTLYLDAGSVAAASLTELAIERQTGVPVSAYSFQMYDFYDDGTLAVRPFRMMPPVWEFRERPQRRYRLVPGAVSDI